MASSVGKVTSDPEPTMVLIVPAKKAAAITSSASRTDMVPGTVDCNPPRAWEPSLGVSAVSDEKPPVEKAVELLVYAPVGMALYVRDMLPSMMGIFVARGKREVQSHRGTSTPPPAPPVPPVPPEMKRRIDESVGMARVMAEGGFGVARDVAGSGLGVAREVAGSAITQFLAMRANGTEPAPPPPPPPRAAAREPEAARGPAPSPPPDATWHTDVPAAEA